jgi:hypothetical protein
MADVDTCPVCGGPAAVTPSGALTCRDHGAGHFRITGWLDTLPPLERAQAAHMPDRSGWDKS